MNGQRIFEAFRASQAEVINLAMSWTKADTARVMSALATGSYKLLPRPLRDLFERVGDQLA